MKLGTKEKNITLQKKSYTEYAKTKNAAKFIDVDPSYLTKRQGTSFKLGIHFFKPIGESIVRWRLSSLTEWLTKDQNNSETIDQKLENLLKRR